jgi:hypothetical protein
MTTPIIVPANQGPEFPADMLTSAQYAEHSGLSPRTLKRVLQAGELPGAVKNSRGAWMIPKDAKRNKPSRPYKPRADQQPVHHAFKLSETALEVLNHTGTVADRLADETAAYLDVATASKLLGVPEYVIRRDPETFNALVYGSRGHRTVMVPQATIRRVLGL